MPLMFRVMGKEDDDKPVIAADAGLGAREGTDFQVGDDTKVILNRHGMSVFSMWQKISPGRIPKRDGGGGEDTTFIFRMGEGPFVEANITPDLVFYPGQGKKKYHGEVAPIRPVTAAEYQAQLAATRDSWVLHDTSAEN